MNTLLCLQALNSIYWNTQTLQIYYCVFHIWFTDISECNTNSFSIMRKCYSLQHKSSMRHGWGSVTCFGGFFPYIFISITNLVISNKSQCVSSVRIWSTVFPSHLEGSTDNCTVSLNHRFEGVLDRAVVTLLIQTVSERHQNCSNSLAANMNHTLFFSAHLN